MADPATQPRHIVIVGAGMAGDALAVFLRQKDPTLPITLVGAEPLPPYQRPPLSKACLAGKTAEADLALRPPGFYADRAITLRLGQPVTTIDAETRHAILADGTRLPFSHLVLATGARPRTLPLPGADLPNVFHLRGAADCAALRQALRPGQHLLIAGGGYIGLEVAATATALGATVTLIEREPRLLARVASPGITTFLHARHQSAGVTIRTNTSLAAITPNGHRHHIHLTDGTTLEADAVLIGVGAIPDESLAAPLGLATGAGIPTGNDGATTLPWLFAIGDVAQRPLPFSTGHGRIESVPNATDMARACAHRLLNLSPPKPEVPWFWSDQFDLKLQIAGFLAGTTATIRREAPETGGFALFHTTNTHITAVETINAPAAFIAGKQFISTNAAPNPTDLANPEIPLRDLLRAA